MEFKKTHQPCPCGSSSDAYSIREDESGYCFSCNKTFRSQERILEDTPELVKPPEEHPLLSGNVEYKVHALRGLTEQTLRKYGISTKFVDGKPTSVSFPYSKEFSKVRKLDEKVFFYVGKPNPGLFGKDAFPDVADNIVITEGEFDAPSVFQALGWHAVSVRSSSSARKDVTQDFEWINRYKNIYLCFDNDTPGNEAVKSVAPLFDFRKLFVVDLNKYKDSNDYLQANDIDSLRTAFRKARKFVPEGVTSSFEDISSILDGKSRTPICGLPFHDLDKLLQGVALGESILFSGLEGIGKTEVLRAIEHKLLKDTDYNIGIVHLEESQKATVNRLLSYEMEAPLYKSDTIIEKDKKLDAYRKLVRRDNRVFYYSFFGEHDPDTLLGIFRYLVAVCGCKVVLFDHINLVVSSMDQGSDERRALDYLCTKISALVTELEFSFIYVCHANDDGKTRGSRNISQTAHVHVRLERQIESADPVERNRLYFSVHKNRPTALSGPAGFCWYDTDIGVLRDPVINPDTDFLTKLPDK